MENQVSFGSFPGKESDVAHPNVGRASCYLGYARCLYSTARDVIPRISRVSRILSESFFELDLLRALRPWTLLIAALNPLGLSEWYKATNSYDNESGWAVPIVLQYRVNIGDTLALNMRYGSLKRNNRVYDANLWTGGRGLMLFLRTSRKNILFRYTPFALEYSGVLRFFSGK